MAVIGLDFGNYNTFPCFIMDMDEDTRLGGKPDTLLPGNLKDGIPSVFFYSERTGVLCGENALKTRAIPVENRIRYLKGHLGESFTIGGRTFMYDDAITEVIQHCVRQANKRLEEAYHLTTNKISLSYPSTYHYPEILRLVQLAQNATLSDGKTHLEVVGTIAEPAAAALDYLAGNPRKEERTTALTYDLGGGTFDLALVSAYPRGRKNSRGKLYYYDKHAIGGDENIGGRLFDKAMEDLLLEKFSDIQLNKPNRDNPHNNAEKYKCDLSDEDEIVASIVVDDEYVYRTVTREEFEERTNELLNSTIQQTKQFLEDHPDPRPDIIVLTGGATHMPQVMKQMKAAFPGYEIVSHDPSRAIAFGAVRYATNEIDNIQLRVSYDLGVRFFNGPEDQSGYFRPFIKAGTPIPCVSEDVISRISREGCDSIRFSVYEANKANTDVHKLAEDYSEIMHVSIDFGKVVPRSTISISRMSVDERGKLTIEAWEESKSEKAAVRCDYVLKVKE